MTEGEKAQKAEEEEEEEEENERVEEGKHLREKSVSESVASMQSPSGTLK